MVVVLPVVVVGRGGLHRGRQKRKACGRASVGDALISEWKQKCVQNGQKHKCSAGRGW